MENWRKSGILILCITLFVIFTGCLSPQNENGTIPGLPSQQSPAEPSPGTMSEKHWIRIDPIRDYKTDSSFNITGSTELVVQGTTNFPAGTLLNLTITEEKHTMSDIVLMSTILEVVGNNSGPNTFSYHYDLKGNFPGLYNIIIKQRGDRADAYSRFNITSDIPYEKWIRIDPIRDYQTDSSFTILGPSDLFINGTTNFPAGKMLKFTITPEQRTMWERVLLKATTEIRGNNSGPNTFSYHYNLKGVHPGQYRVEFREEWNKERITASSRFNITSDFPYYKWIRINPVGEAHPGEPLTVSGTTDMPAGSEILISIRTVAHTCTPGTPDPEGQRTYCGGGCDDSVSDTVQVVEGARGTNTWNSTLNISNMCIQEDHFISVDAVNWTNVTSDYEDVQLLP